MKRYLVLVLSMLLLLSGCGGEKKPSQMAEAPPTSPLDLVQNTPAATENPEATEAPVEPTEPLYRNGLNGDPLEEPLESRPYAVMINNIKVAQPHCGVSEADIIYEVLVEGTTRMMAIFSDISEAGAIGSMRSIRPYFVELARSYDAIVVHAGGSDQAYADISSKDIDNMDGVRGNYGSSIFYRDPSRASSGYEHSLFTTADKVLEYTPIMKFREDHSEDFEGYGFSFSDDATPADGTDAKDVVVTFGSYNKTTSFKYDADKGNYTASQYGSSYIDGNTGKAPEFENVLVLYAKTKVLDNAGRLSVTLTGTGEGHYISGGKSVDISWSREADGAIFKYTNEDGSDLTLTAGKTYICIVPTDSNITMK